MRKLLTFLIALGAIVFAVYSPPVSAPGARIFDAAKADTDTGLMDGHMLRDTARINIRPSRDVKRWLT
jgi:hypothetical protein